MPTPLRALALAVAVSGITVPSLGQDDPHSETRSAGADVRNDAHAWAR